MRHLTAPYILTPEGLRRNRIVTVADDGTIVEIRECHNPDREESVEWYNGVLIPGMVNAHCHLELSYVRGKVTPHGGFAGFAQGLRAARHGVSTDQMTQAAELWDNTMWQAGVEAVGDVCNGSLTFEVKRRSRIHYHNFVELYGLGQHNATEVRELAEQAREMGLSATPTPHSLYSLRDEAYADVIDSQRLSLHFAESREEVDLFSQQGAMWEWYRSAGFEAPFIGQYGSPVERLLALTPRNRQMVLVHACEVSHEDVKAIESHFEVAPVWVVCPRSNDFISELRPPVEVLRECGSKVAVGTDSLASNTTLDMMAELSAMPTVPLAERLQWATHGGAEALGMEQSLGSLRVDTRPGVVLVEGVDFESMQLRPGATSRRLV